MSNNKAKELDSILTGQDFADVHPSDGELERYKNAAYGYAVMENSIAVLSDMRSDTSYIYYGGFAERLGIACGRHADTVKSIWEKDILSLVHPDDLPRKYLQELTFFRFMKNRPASQRHSYCMAGMLRMRDASGRYVPSLHRLMYIPEPSRSSMWLAMCLYGPLPAGFGRHCIIMNTVNGHITELDSRDGSRLLSARERQVLRLIDGGMPSKYIAEEMSISVNTVNRHRQNILCKLQAKSSIEACRIAKSLKLI